MHWISNTITEFGEQLGIAGLELNAQGVVRLEMASGICLTLEPQVRRGQQELLASLGARVGHEAAGYIQAALRRIHAENFPPANMQLVLAGHGTGTLLIVTTRMSSMAVTAQALSGTVGTLQRWLEGVMAEGSNCV